MKQLKIGLQLYSIRDAMEQDLVGALRAVKEMGYDYVEYAGENYGKTWTEIRQILDDVGLECVSVHQGLNEFLDNPEQALDQVRSMGAEYCVICRYGLENYLERWDETMDKIRRWSEGIHKAGLRGLYHNHAFEFESVGGDYILNRIFEIIPKELLRPELDTAWIHYGGVDPVEYINKFAGEIKLVHLKDFYCANLPQEPVYELVKKHGRSVIPATLKEAGFQFRPVGSGIQEWKSILDACREAGVEYVIVEQDESTDCSQLEAAEKSIRYLKSVV